MNIDLKQNYFELFDISMGFAVDTEKLAISYRNLQRAVHPDKFAGDEEKQKRLALQTASFVNQAYKVLDDPLERGIYLLGLVGFDLEQEHTVQMAADFMSEQIELREAIEVVKEISDLDALQNRLMEKMQVLFARFESEMQATDYPAAASVIRKLQFYNKLKAESRELRFKLEGELI